MDEPAGAVCPSGWIEMEGGKPMVTVATLLVMDPKALLMMTV
jgi:hypothetical protein